MWYLANLMFDYEEFMKESKTIVVALERGDYSVLWARAQEVIVSGRYTGFFRKYGYGVLPEVLPQVEELKHNPYMNSELGLWFLICMTSDFEEPNEHIGFDYLGMVEIMKRLGWSERQLELLINGRPVAKLFQQEFDLRAVVTHSDPYWAWIRPRYSFNHGGWLSIEDCKNMLLEVSQTFERESGASFLQQHDLYQNYWRGIRKLKNLFEQAISKCCGIYNIIYWEWED